MLLQVQAYRARMVEAGAGARLAAVSMDNGYDREGGIHSPELRNF